MKAAASFHLRNVEIEGRAGLDVRLAEGRVCEIGRRLAGDGPQIDAAGGALIPGLHDHHLHLFAMAARAESLDVGEASKAGLDAFAWALRTGASRLAPGKWLRATGFDETVIGIPDRHDLDLIVAERPVRVQDRSGALWLLNSAALARLSPGVFGADDDVLERDDRGVPTGRIWRGDAWLRSRLEDRPPSLAAVGAALARYGVTGVTDASVTTDQDQTRAFAEATRLGELRQRLMLMSGGQITAAPGETFVVGPVKILLDERNLPAFEAARTLVARARSWNRPVAAHCVTAAELAFFLALMRDVGARPGDRVEHGGIIHPSAIPIIRDLGLTVVTQPAFIHAKGERYFAEVEPADLPHLYPCAALLGAGVGLAASSDAPYGPADPWLAIATAASRRTAAGRSLGEAERVGAAKALALYLSPLEDPRGPPRRVALGVPADLCLLRLPLDQALAAPSQDNVRATFIAGEMVHGDAGAAEL